jgi:hypothetical protein
LAATFSLTALLWQETTMERDHAAGIFVNNKVQVCFVGDSSLSASGVCPLPLGRHGGGSRKRLTVTGGEDEVL